MAVRGWRIMVGGYFCTILRFCAILSTCVVCAIHQHNIFLKNVEMKVTVIIVIYSLRIVEISFSVMQQFQDRPFFTTLYHITIVFVLNVMSFVPLIILKVLILNPTCAQTPGFHHIYPYPLTCIIQTTHCFSLDTCL